MCDLKCHFKAQSAVLSTEAKDAAAEIERRLQLGSKLSEVVSSKEDVLALFDLYRNEAYILTEHKGRFFVSKLLALFFFLDKCAYIYIMRQKATKHTGSIHSSLNKNNTQAIPKNLKAKRTPLPYTP